MSSYMVVAGVSAALKSVLWDELSADPEVGQLFPSEDDIVFTNPTQTAQNTSNRLSIWLYQIAENEYVKNRPMGRANGPELLEYPPLALNFSYLITPFANISNGDNPTRDEDHLVLGKVMQVLHDNAIIILRDSTNDIAEELRIIFKRLTLEELTRIWEALREPYRLSICYQVQVMRINSKRVDPNARIVERNTANEVSPAQAVG